MNSVTKLISKIEESNRDRMSDEHAQNAANWFSGIVEKATAHFNDVGIVGMRDAEESLFRSKAGLKPVMLAGFREAYNADEESALYDIEAKFTTSAGDELFFDAEVLSDSDDGVSINYWNILLNGECVKDYFEESEVDDCFGDFVANGINSFFHYDVKTKRMTGAEAVEIAKLLGIEL